MSSPLGSIWRRRLSNCAVAQTIGEPLVLFVAELEVWRVRPCRPESTPVRAQERTAMGSPWELRATLRRALLDCWEIRRRLSLMARISWVWAAAGKAYSTTLFAGDVSRARLRVGKNAVRDRTDKHEKKRMMIL
jgi:hypothetical protein